jgi:hypothetical protein
MLCADAPNCFEIKIEVRCSTCTTNPCACPLQHPINWRTWTRKYCCELC